MLDLKHATKTGITLCYINTRDIVLSTYNNNQGKIENDKITPCDTEVPIYIKRVGELGGLHKGGVVRVLRVIEVVQ